MKFRITGRLILAVTALAVAILCLFRLFVPGICAGVAGTAAALIIGLFRHGNKSLSETAESAAREADSAGNKGDQA